MSVPLEELIIRPQDIYACRFCASGARRWFAAHGFSWADFIRNGIPAATMLATGDALGRRVVKHAQKMSGGRNG